MGKTEYEKNVRKVILNDGEIEIVRNDWAPGSSSDWHDHGNSYGISMVARGAICETRKGMNERVILAGETFTEGPHTIHKITSPHGAVTYHIYCPPVTGTMKVFPDEPK